MWQSKPLLLVVLLLCLSGSLSVRAAEPTPDSYPRVQSRAGWEASAAAQGLPPLTPRKIWWTLGWNAKTTTSHCIGDPRSPLCAAETMMACEARKEIGLCYTATSDPSYAGNNSYYPGLWRNPASGLMRYAYDSGARLNAERAAALSNQEFIDVPLQEGDVFLAFTYEICGRADNTGSFPTAAIPRIYIDI